ncbi:MAG: M1 family aminopeptidase [Desulfobacterales bacterium]
MIGSSHAPTRFILLWSLMVMGVALPSWAAGGLEHTLSIRLDPENQRLSGEDLIRWEPETREALRLRLAPQAVIQGVTVAGRPAAYRFNAGRLTLTRLPREGAPLEIIIAYEAVFDDPFPESTANTDNPGYGVTGIVSPQGTFLLAGSGWYPQGDRPPSRIDLAVDAPPGVVAVTAGRFLGHETVDGRTLSKWAVAQPSEALSLSAGRYQVTQRSLGEIQLATFFLPETQPLAERYLTATARYIELYSDLFGPYPFEKFAVVENFFPTGYGFPSYTLMGGSVLRLPFIVDVSLGHEIAHCWWGNGVQVDYSAGNWSEGLTTYVADYLFKEQHSTQAAQEYRRQWLRNYAALVDPASDFPLNQFMGRVNRPTKVVGYDKSAMVFHMLRRLAGDEIFWGALSDIYSKKLFSPASWQDFRRAFEARAGDDLKVALGAFFNQWVARPGAPQLSLESVARTPHSGGWQVSGRVRQTPPVYSLPLALRIETQSGAVEQGLVLAAEATAFSFIVDDKPLRVLLDPEVEIFRRLSPQEVPATVNAIKGAPEATLVLARNSGDTGRQTAQMLIRALGLHRARIVDEADLEGAVGPGSARIFIGRPEDEALVPALPRPVRLTPRAISVADQTYGAPTDTLFAVVADSRQPGAVTALLTPLHPDLAPLVARKVTHYGKYSYLVFQEGQNREKGTWPLSDSPMVFQWEDSLNPTSSKG